MEAQAAPIFGALRGAYAALRQNERFGNYLLRTADGAVLATDFVPERTPAGLPVLYADTVVNLTRAGAQELAEALRTLFAGSREPVSGDPAQRHAYMLMVALLPLR